MPAYKDSKGKWYVKFYADTWDGNKKQVLKRGFSTKKDALAYEHEYKASKQHSPSITLQTLYNEFKADYKANSRPSSYNVTTCIIKRHILPYLGDFPINEITPIMCRKWQNEIKEKITNENSRHNIEAKFRLLMNFAVKYYNLPKNPLKQLSGIGRITAKNKVITTEDFKAIEQYFDVVDHAAFNLLFYTGMRISELRGLTVQDIDFTKNTININKQLLQYKPSPLKTDTSSRVISVPVFVLDKVKAFFDGLPALPHFPFSILSANALRYRLKIACQKAEIEPISPHTLRHSHATLLITNNIPVNIISRRLGHANITTTLNVYSHVFRHSEEGVIDVLNLVSK